MSFLTGVKLVLIIKSPNVTMLHLFVKENAGQRDTVSSNNEDFFDWRLTLKLFDSNCKHCTISPITQSHLNKKPGHLKNNNYNNESYRQKM